MSDLHRFESPVCVKSYRQPLMTTHDPSKGDDDLITPQTFLRHVTFAPIRPPLMPGTFLQSNFLDFDFILPHSLALLPQPPCSPARKARKQGRAPALPNNACELLPRQVKLRVQVHPLRPHRQRPLEKTHQFPAGLDVEHSHVTNIHLRSLDTNIIGTRKGAPRVVTRTYAVNWAHVTTKVPVDTVGGPRLGGRRQVISACKNVKAEAAFKAPLAYEPY